MRRIVSIILLIPLNVIFAQNDIKQVSFRELTVEDGLSQNSVISIAQDSTGYMWFATQDGLNQYDGRRFTIYNKQFEDVTRPTFNKLGKIYVDKIGQLWIITNSGQLELFNRKKETFQPINNISNVNIVFQDRSLNRYIGTFGNGLFRINPSTQDTVQVFAEEDQKRTVYDIIEITDKLFIAASGCVFMLKGESYTKIELADNLRSNYSALAKTKHEKIWLGTFGNGLYFKNNNDVSFKQYQTLSKNLNIQDILVDKKDRTWIATYGDGVYLIDSKGETIQHFEAKKSNPYALHYNDVLSIYEDYTGTIWFGTDGAGLSYYDEHLAKFNVLTNSQMPTNVNVDVVRSISVDNQTIWLGTSGKGLTKISLNTQDYRTFTTSNSNISSNRIMSLCHDKNKLWIGHQGFGLDLLAGKDFRSFPSLSKMTIWKIVKASEKTLWLATRENGLLLFDEQKGILKQFNKTNSSLSTNNIRTIEIDSYGIIWIGTDDSGLFKLNMNNDEVEIIIAVPDNIKSLLIDNRILWVGTNGNGLKAYNIDSNEVEQFTIDDGLPNNVIYGILKGQEDLWLSSNRGITQFKLEESGRPLITNYGNYDGLQAFEFNTGAYFKDEKGNLYFGGLDGLNWFNPRQLTLNQTKPKTIISNLEIFNKEYPIQDNQEFKHNENTITFTFSGLHFSQPERNLYKYRLINNDEDWISSGTTNAAHYTNLPPNDYEFQVLSSNYDGIWDDRPATYQFSILKPWYATNLARTIYGLFLALLVFTIYKYLKFRWELKTQLRLEHAETERLKKLDEFKTKLYTNISHEFRTPLTLISGPVDKQLQRENLTVEDKKDLGLVKQNANRLLNLVNQMLDLSLVDSGQLDLKVSKGNLSVLVKQIIAAFQYKSKDKAIDINANIQDIKDVYFDDDIIEKVLSNLLSNAIKYAPAKTEVKVDLAKQNDMAVLSVINTFNDVKRKNLTKLFQRFYQDNEASDGVGVGLALVKELVNLSKGTVIANTVEDNKIQFSVTLPVSKESFLAEEILEDQEKGTEGDNANGLVKGKDEPLILIAEDDDDIRNFIGSIFKKDYGILLAENGQVGIELAQEHLPDVIISDIMMPISDGIALCNTIKYNTLTSHIPVILLTAKAGEEDEIIGLKTGADAYITKPFNTKKLQARVDQLIHNRKQLQTHYSRTFSINPDLAITSTETEFLVKLQDVLDEHITNSDFTSEKFSELLLMSRTQLHRKLKAIAGMSTSEFIRSQRLKIAAELLVKSDDTISEVAYKVGFNSPSYFIKCFKLQFNSTPSEYQSANK